MPAEVFRFMTVRPPQAAPSTAGKNAIELNATRSDFLTALAEKSKAGSRDGMEKDAAGFIARNESFIASKRRVYAKFLAFHDAVHDLDERGFLPAVRDALAGTLGATAAEVVDSGEFGKLYSDLTHSLIAAAIDLTVSAKLRGLLVGLARTVGLLIKLARSERFDYKRSEFYAQIIVLPEGIFPLPVVRHDSEGEARADEGRRARAAADRQKLVELAQELSANKAAIHDILTTYEKASFRPGRAVTMFTASDAGATGPGGFVLSDSDANRLSVETRKVIETAGIAGSIDVARTTSMIERRSNEISNKLFASSNTSRYLVNIGNSFVPSDALVGTRPEVFPDATLVPAHPGPCPPIPAAEASDEVTVPLWTTHGDARVLGFADLMLVEQELLRYELGEIAHVENVLVGELREREFRTATTTETSTTTESERTEENSKDLATAERFELQTESEKVINESTSTAAGVTVSASYGPTVDVTANFNFASNTAKQASERASNTFARDTTTKATSKIQTRTLERRFSRTVSEVEEKNKHSFENRENDAVNISGVYRFVDKIYNAQVVSYGKRFMLEFLVPEPAAFLRHAMTRQPAEGVTQVKPEAPGYCQNGVFVELQPQDVSVETYLFWAAKYLATDVTPPPSNTQIVSGVLINETPGTKSQFTDDVYEASELKELKVPSGYKPTKVIVTAEGWSVARANFPSTFSVQIQKEIVIVPNQATFTVNLESDVTDKIPVAVVTKNFEKYAVVATVFCVITPERYQEWQLKTYTSIMNAYTELKSRFDTAMEASRIRATFTTVSGTNPAANREREKIELRKACVSLLTGQSFEAFDSVRRGVAPHGYPELAFADAEAEGRYIQFFENAFEWTNITYVFYPYFWGKKEFWITTSQISDSDPVYERFLQAGAARVQVPVRPGFEIALINFLGIRNVWFGDGTLVSGDSDEGEDLYVSVLDEIKEQLGNQAVVGNGRLTVTKNDALVTGSETTFTKDDEDKRIVMRGKTYVIQEVISATQIRLTAKYSQESETGVRYSMGAKLIGEPWEVKVPTSLVMIDRENSPLIVS